MEPCGKETGVSNANGLRVVGALAVVVALGVLGIAAAALGSSSAKATETAEISMERKGKRLFFEGPNSVESGAKLKVENNTNPRVVGPHTFSLVERAALPKSKEEKRDCRNFAGICGKIAEAHEVDPETGMVSKPNIDNGKKGWDRATTPKRAGDSWVVQRKGASESREVSAKPGEKLFFLCAVHPRMQDKLEVEG
jgi:hypothetical protein